MNIAGGVRRTRDVEWEKGQVVASKEEKKEQSRAKVRKAPPAEAGERYADPSPLRLAANISSLSLTGGPFGVLFFYRFSMHGKHSLLIDRLY